MAIAEWTCAPLDFSSWHCRQVLESAFGSSGTGCVAALAHVAEKTTNNANQGRDLRIPATPQFVTARSPSQTLKSRDTLCIDWGMSAAANRGNLKMSPNRFIAFRLPLADFPSTEVKPISLKGLPAVLRCEKNSAEET
jgi:hypothetical protein